MESSERGNGMGNLIGIAIVVLGAIWIYNTWINPPKWSMTYIDDYNIARSQGEYKTREECAFQLGVATRHGLDSPECGLDCKPPETSNGLYKCKETFN